MATGNYTIELMDWTREETYVLPCGDGTLSDMEAMTTGTKTDRNNVSWSLSGGTSDDDYYVYQLTGSSLPGNYEIGNIFESIRDCGVMLYHCASKLEEYIPLGGSYSFVGVDQATQYPNYLLTWAPAPDSAARP